MPLGEAEPPKPPEAGTPTPPFRPKIGRTEINMIPWRVIAATPFADDRMRAGRGWVVVVVAMK